MRPRRPSRAPSTSSWPRPPRGARGTATPDPARSCPGETSCSTSPRSRPAEATASGTSGSSPRTSCSPPATSSRRCSRRHTHTSRKRGCSPAWRRSWPSAAARATVTSSCSPGSSRDTWTASWPTPGTRYPQARSRARTG